MKQRKPDPLGTVDHVLPGAPPVRSPRTREWRHGYADERTVAGEPHVLVVGPDGMALGGAPGGSDDGESREVPVTDMVEQPAKVMRIGSMIKQLLEEVRAAPLDEASRARLKEIHSSSVKELEDGLAPELVEELERLSLPFTEESIPTEAELRIAQAQLVGWLEGLFHGIQTALFAQQMAARAQLEQMRRALPPGVGGGEDGQAMGPDARRRPLGPVSLTVRLAGVLSPGNAGNAERGPACIPRAVPLSMCGPGWLLRPVETVSSMGSSLSGSQLSWAVGVCFVTVFFAQIELFSWLTVLYFQPAASMHFFTESRFLSGTKDVDLALVAVGLGEVLVLTDRRRLLVLGPDALGGRGV